MQNHMHTKPMVGHLTVLGLSTYVFDTNLSGMYSPQTYVDSPVTDLTCWVGNWAIISGSCLYYGKFSGVCLVHALCTETTTQRCSNFPTPILYAIKLIRYAKSFGHTGKVAQQTYIPIWLAWSSNCTFANKDGPISASERLWAETVSVWIASWMMEQQTLQGVWLLT